MDRDILLALAERCEVATTGDRHLDTEILWNIDRRRFLTGYWNAASGMPRELTEMPSSKGGIGWIGAECSAPTYTASLDAAVKVVPEGWGWSVNQPNAKALASGLFKERTPIMGEVQFGCDHRFAVACATPALALCAAALRARAQEPTPC